MSDYFGALMNLSGVGTPAVPVADAAAAPASDVVELERRPHAYGLMYIAINVGAAIAPLVGGLLATHAFEYLFWGDALTSCPLEPERRSPRSRKPLR